MDQAGKEKEALQLLAEADKKVRGSQSFFAGLFGGSSRIEEACDIYARAANMFKMAKNWSAAGNAFCQAAQLHLQLQSKHDAATNFVDAGNAFKKADPQEAINCLIRAIEIYTDMGRFTIAAKHHISIAEIYEAELVDIEKAIAHYEQAADYYKGEESNSSANKCLLKVATYAAQLEQYQKAVEIYEQVGTSAMDSPLLKYSAKEYFFKAALCHFCIDMLNAKVGDPPAPPTPGPSGTPPQEPGGGREGLGGCGGHRGNRLSWAAGCCWRGVSGGGVGPCPGAPLLSLLPSLLPRPSFLLLALLSSSSSSSWPSFLPLPPRPPSFLPLPPSPAFLPSSSSSPAFLPSLLPRPPSFPFLPLLPRPPSFPFLPLLPRPPSFPF
ncbi:alpha-soluble NSF attachment protein, partial [Strix aluco]|uniref:alpha-soluble NSF attachment protein n=1 Tax=Strix aluco TaxID=111821 RepID=UPI003DA3B73D